MRRLTRGLPALALAAACAQPAPAPPAVDIAAGEQAIAAYWTAYTDAAITENVDAAMALFTENPLLDAKGMPPIMGREALDAALRPIWQDVDIQSFEVTPGYTHVVSNDLVHQAGSFIESFEREGSTAVEFGRYAMALERGADGQWRAGYLMAFADSMVSR